MSTPEATADSLAEFDATRDAANEQRLKALTS